MRFYNELYVTSISGIIDHYSLYHEKLKKNREKIRTDYEQYTLKIMNILRTASLESNFTGSSKESSVYRRPGSGM